MKFKTQMCCLRRTESLVVLSKKDWRNVVAALESKSSELYQRPARDGSVNNKAWARGSDEFEALASRVAEQTGVER